MANKPIKRGRPREKDYSKLNFKYEHQLNKGVYLIYNDRLKKYYVGSTDESFAERYSKREIEYRLFKDGKINNCHHSNLLLFEHDDSKMEWLFIPSDGMVTADIRHMEDLLIKTFSNVTNINAKRFVDFEVSDGYLNVPLLERYGFMHTDPHKPLMGNRMIIDIKSSL